VKILQPTATSVESESRSVPSGEAFIRRVFYMDRGWKAHPMLGNQRVTLAELRRLRDRRATHIQVFCNGRFTDVEIAKLLSRMAAKEALRRWGMTQ
jgi:hypothetical protein